MLAPRSKTYIKICSVLIKNFSIVYFDGKFGLFNLFATKANVAQFAKLYENASGVI